VADGCSNGPEDLESGKGNASFARGLEGSESDSKALSGENVPCPLPNPPKV
jgi:hypothetical protein